MVTEEDSQGFGVAVRRDFADNYLVGSSLEQVEGLSVAAEPAGTVDNILPTAAGVVTEEDSQGFGVAAEGYLDP